MNTQLDSSIIINDSIATINTGITPAGIAITPDGNYAYIANNNNYGLAGEDSVTVLNLPDNTVLTTIYHTSFNQPYTVSIDPTGTYAYVSNSHDSTVSVIDIAINNVVQVIDGFDGPSGFAITADGSKAYVNNYGGPNGVKSGNGTSVNVVNLQNKTIVGTITVGLAPAALALSPDGKFCYVINYGDGNPNNGSLSIIDTSCDVVTNTVSGIGLSGPFAIAITPDSAFAYITNFGSNNFAPIGHHVIVVDLANPSWTCAIAVGLQPAGIAITPDGRHAFVSNYNTLYAGSNYTSLTAGQGTVNIIDIATNTLLPFTLPVGQSPAGIAITPNGSNAYVTNYTSNTVSVISLP
ncbi:YncE family protein [Undibacterium sp. CY18W]|uniref:YncE family protein n=1 Tax=Undibacterium hunanense TaxID=2762292 RepID=A0ABR6ZT41_9BURK|nr:YncE family protein [Undibacterium hunanense]MBC3919051.1 YncE family protein [Undibacterium hunanense]